MPSDVARIPDRPAPSPGLIEPAWLRERYWDDGLTIPQIAMITHLTVNQVHAEMKKHGIPRRAPGRRSDSADALLHAPLIRQYEAYLKSRRYARITISKSLRVACVLIERFSGDIPCDRAALTEALATMESPKDLQTCRVSGVNRLVDFLERLEDEKREGSE